jgi:phosphoribosyl 1,2-cyclic phosphodiesterase
MFRFTVLGSGSAGNCALVETDRVRVLVDAGLSARQILHRLALLGLKPEDINAVLLTHEHGDHTGGLEVLCRRWDVPIYTNALTADAMRHSGQLESHRNWRLFQTGRDFAIENMDVQNFSVPHDAADPVGFVLNHDASALGVLTDLGQVTKLAFTRIRHVTTLFIETNHDGPLLQQDTKRPWSVKQRILSRHGHLSNDAAALAVGELRECGEQLGRVVLGHLSRDCNRPELAIGAVRARAGVGFEIHCAQQSAVSPQFAISAGPREQGTRRNEQDSSTAEDHFAAQAELF